MLKEFKNDEKNLYEAILSLKTEEECRAFLLDVCTIQELEALTQRLAVAIKLGAGETYVDINKSTGASTATIGRVAKALNYGSGGYRTVLERLGDKNEK